MVLIVLTQNFCIDSLTGFLNLFGLIKAINTDQIGDWGTIVFIYLEKFKAPNKQVSLEKYLKFLSPSFEAIKDKFKEEDSALPTIPLRIGDNDFVLIYPQKTSEEAQNLTNLFTQKFYQHLKQEESNQLSIRVSVMNYGQKEKDPSFLLRLIFCKQITSYQLEKKGELSMAVKQLLSNLAEHICQSYGLLHQAQDLAMSDDISGLPNHRAAKSVLDQKLSQSLEEQQPFSILFIDGDNLKQYNNLSYQKGNLMIRNLAEILASQLRRGDFLARWFSGDEFLVLLPCADRKEAFRIGERLRSVVEDTTKIWPYPITISVGMASYPDDGGAMEELLLKAEKANALAKKGGKNQVCEAKTEYKEMNIIHCQQANCN